MTTEIDSEAIRDPATGRYAHSGDLSRACVCGHELGDHVHGGFECLGAGTPCDCDKFRPAPEKAAPIPADVLALADVLSRCVLQNLRFTQPVIRDLVARAIMQDLADREARPSLPDSREERASAAERDVLAERRRQVEDEGWTPEHDDAHEDEELAAAAGCYAWPSWAQQGGGHLLDSPDRWPWADSAWRPTNRRQMLVKAGALILAEIERLDRARQGGNNG